MQKKVTFKTLGMQRDFSESQQAQSDAGQFAYENMNMRVYPTKDNTLLSLVNERGNYLVNRFSFDLKNSKVLGHTVARGYIRTINKNISNPYCWALGYDATDSNCQLTDIAIVFVKDGDGDHIYAVFEAPNYRKSTKKSPQMYKSIVIRTIYSGSLNFDYEHPIECISYHENADVLKVYWTDGLNPARYLNIMRYAFNNDIVNAESYTDATHPYGYDSTRDGTAIYTATEHDSSGETICINENKYNVQLDKGEDIFNCVPTVALEEGDSEITITKDTDAGGMFPAGVIQYAFTYLDAYGCESNVFYASSLYYTSHPDRGGSPDDKVSNSFLITLKNVDYAFDYIRVYSIMRTTLDAEPTVKRVVDLMTQYNTTIKYTDNGLNGELVDPTELFYVGGRSVVPYTLEQKDNTLFYGNLNLQEHIIAELQIADTETGELITLNEYFRKQRNKSDSDSTKVVKIVTSDIPVPYSQEYNDETKQIEPVWSLPKREGFYPYTSQLCRNSSEITFFKYGETYRLGFQAQYKTGAWSDVIWIADWTNTSPISHIGTDGEDNYDESAEKYEVYVSKPYCLIPQVVRSVLHLNGYVRIRPVVVYPDINDRTIKYQGLVCPTVFNAYDRFTNSPFSQMSWFLRPSYSGSVWDNYYGLGGGNSYIRNVVPFSFGDWVQFEHYTSLCAPHDGRHGELQCMSDTVIGNSMPEKQTNDEGNVDLKATEDKVNEVAETFYIDQSIITMHSPDLEFDSDVKLLNSDGLSFKVNGITYWSQFAGDIDIQTSTPVQPPMKYDDGEMVLDTDYRQYTTRGFVKNPFGVTYLEDRQYGWNQLCSGGFWQDFCYPDVTFDGDSAFFDSPQRCRFYFMVYPWHRNGSLNNTRYAHKENKNSTSSGYSSSMLKKKIISNIHYSYSTYYSANNDQNGTNPLKEWEPAAGVSGITIFDSDTLQLVRLNPIENSSLGFLNYYGNIDKLLTATKQQHLSNVKEEGWKSVGYPIVIENVDSSDAPKYGVAPMYWYYIDYSGKPEPKSTSDKFLITTMKEGKDNYAFAFGLDPVRMRYKTTTHAVIAFNYYTNEGGDVYRVTLPTYSVSSSETNQNKDNGTGKKYFWEEVAATNLTESWEDSSSSITPMGYLWMGEVYNDKVENRFGGTTEEAIENNKWIPAADPEPIIQKSHNTRVFMWLEGDTYYQRYDCLKTYAFSPEDQNQVVDIASFMCETHVNIDGRYDRNRGQASNLYADPSNFNKINPVYSQRNNFFIQRAVNTNKIHLNNFRNSVTWTKTKVAGSLRDDWTDITLVSVMDMDGDKGAITSLQRFNNNLICFQEKGLSQIIYNERTTMTTQEGVPVEVANSQKVTGKAYISNIVGCNNKWSICNTPSGIYFIDGFNSKLYTFIGTEIVPISDKLHFASWFGQQDNVKVWDPKNFNSTISFYDRTTQEVMFVMKDSCLVFSEMLGQFTSFYNYEGCECLFNVNDRAVAIKDRYLYLQREGEYNDFFGYNKSFYTKLIVSPEFKIDKIFDCIDFNADSFDPLYYAIGDESDRFEYSKTDDAGNTKYVADDTFDYLEVENEYQKGWSSLVFDKAKPSNLKKKFRTWHAVVPRDMLTGTTKRGGYSSYSTGRRDRIRGPWMYLKLQGNTSKEKTYKTILHDITVTYFASGKTISSK